MHITSLRLQNFKRFTDLTIQGIPENTKLVLLLGANGSGKSSVFDAFELVNTESRLNDIHVKDPDGYYRKDKAQGYHVSIKAGKKEKCVRFG